MWYIMAKAQHSYQLSDRLIRAISNWQISREDEDIEDILNQGVDVNNMHGTLLPLHCACMVGDSYTLQLLLERGAQVNTLDGYGRAAIHYAAEQDVTCLEMLLEANADPNILDYNQDTALHWASFKNKPRCAKVLLQHGADVNATDYNSDTPMSWAAMKGNLEIIKVLLEYNAKVDTLNGSGHSPLHRAATIQAAGLTTNVDDAVLELLIKADGQFDLRVPEDPEDPNSPFRLSRSIDGDNKLRELLLPYCVTSRPLQQLCRFSVRRFLGNCYLPNVVLKLPLPQRVLEYVLLQR